MNSYDLLERAHLAKCNARAIGTSNHMISGQHHYRSTTMHFNFNNSFGFCDAQMIHESLSGLS